MTDHEEAMLLRVRTLERRQRRLMAFIALLAAVLVWTEAAPRQTMRAQRFAVVDSDGNETGFWGVGRDGPIFVLRDGRGVWRGWLQVTDDGSFLRLSGPTDDHVSTLGTAGGPPRLELQGAGDTEPTVISAGAPEIEQSPAADPDPDGPASAADADPDLR